jgi:hypothetical protein
MMCFEWVPIAFFDGTVVNVALPALQVDHFGEPSNLPAEVILRTSVPSARIR